MSKIIRLILSPLERPISALYIWLLWGSRCSAYDKRCPVCEQWREHDELFKGWKKLTGKGEREDA